jgi:hypothetical protein
MKRGEWKLLRPFRRKTYTPAAEIFLEMAAKCLITSIFQGSAEFGPCVALAAGGSWLKAATG